MLAAVLVPFLATSPNTDAALAILVVVAAVAAGGDRLAGGAGRWPALDPQLDRMPRQ